MSDNSFRILQQWRDNRKNPVATLNAWLREQIDNHDMEAYGVRVSVGGGGLGFTESPPQGGVEFRVICADGSASTKDDYVRTCTEVLDMLSSPAVADPYLDGPFTYAGIGLPSPHLD